MHGILLGASPSQLPAGNLLGNLRASTGWSMHGILLGASVCIHGVGTARYFAWHLSMHPRLGDRRVICLAPLDASTAWGSRGILLGTSLGIQLGTPLLTGNDLARRL